MLLAIYIAGVRLYGGLKAADRLKLPKASSFHHEYSSMACTVEIVKDVLGAIDHIHEHGRYVSIIVSWEKHLFIQCLG